MRNKVLYFPYINVPNSSWFTRILLYWDEVGAIVPYEFIEVPEKLDEHTRSLVQECLVKQVLPQEHIYNIPSFRDSFLKYINSLKNKVIKRRRMSFRKVQNSKIHIEKMDGLEYELKDIGLAKEGDYPWWFIEENTAWEFMAYLAATLGKLPDLQLDPISDDIRHLQNFLYSSRSEKLAHKKISNLRLEILEDIFPSPQKPLKAFEISIFKEKHGDKLKAFRNRVEKEIIDIADVENKELRKRRLALFKDESRDAIKEIIDAMKSSGFKGSTLSKFGSIISSIPGVSPIFGLAKAVCDAFKKQNFQTIDPCFIYAAYAQKEILSQDAT